jgi:predicted O-methyltransferase YrrM
MILGVPAFDAPDTVWNMPVSFRQEYIASKYAIACEFRPRRICEIGVFTGISAKCFLAASPQAEYVGIDNKYAERGLGVEAVEHARRDLQDLGYKAFIHILDSQRLDRLPDPPYDFIHVDGDHDRACAAHDVTLAWHALTDDGVILVDNGHDMGVAAGTFDALYQLRMPNHPLVDWRYYSGKCGNILITKRPFVI